MNILSKDKTRFNGPVPQIADMIKSSAAGKQQLIEWLEKFEQIEAQIEEAERLSVTLPADIDKLLKSGKMDNQTVEALAKKRAHLDLLPARVDSLTDQLSELHAEFETIGSPLESAVVKADHEYGQKQTDAAADELLKLGVDKEVAIKQAKLRPDIRRLHTFAISTECGGMVSADRARKILWCFESYEQGLYPHSKAAEKIKKQWIKE